MRGVCEDERVCEAERLLHLKRGVSEGASGSWWVLLQLFPGSRIQNPDQTKGKYSRLFGSTTLVVTWEPPQDSETQGVDQTWASVGRGIEAGEDVGHTEGFFIQV